jgi:hypothetical protein
MGTHITMTIPLYLFSGILLSGGCYYTLLLHVTLDQEQTSGPRSGVSIEPQAIVTMPLTSNIHFLLFYILYLKFFLVVFFLFLFYCL